MRVFVTTPTYNEIDNIDALIDAVLALGDEYELVVVDDNSPDGTGDRVRARQTDQPRLHLIARPGKLGLASAEIAGLRYGFERGGDLLIHMDADFSHHPKYLPEMVARASAGDVDIVIGSRYAPGGGTRHWGWRRVVLSRGANLTARVLLGLPVHDCTSGFRCYRRRVVAEFDFDQVTVDGYAYLTEMTYLCCRAGYRFAQVPIIFEDRRLGQSKISRRIVFEAMRLVLRRFGQRLMGR